MKTHFSVVLSLLLLFHFQYGFSQINQPSKDRPELDRNDPIQSFRDSTKDRQIKAETPSHASGLKLIQVEDKSSEPWDKTPHEKKIPFAQKNNTITLVEKDAFSEAAAGWANPNKVSGAGSDLCSGAVSLTTPTNAGTNVSATLSASDPICCNLGSGPEGTVWFLYTPPTNGVVSFTITAGTMTYPLFDFYYGSCSALYYVSSGCGTASPGKYSMSYTVSTCQSYYLMVYDDRKKGNMGTFTITSSFTSAASPANDCCTNAYPIPSANLNGTWNTGFTTVGATPDAYWYGSPCNYANNNVWFSFVAQGPNVEVTVSGTSAYFEPEVSIFNATCNPAAASIISCNNLNGYYYSTISTMNNSPSATQLISGNTYYIMVTNEGTAGSFSIQVNNPPPNPPGTDCATASVLCSSGTYSGAANLWGTQELTSSTIYACNFNREINSSWYVLNVQTGGSLTFTLNPTNGTDDYDYAIYSGSTCTLGAPITCNYSSTKGATGISTASGGTTNSTGSTGIPWNKDLSLSAGTYLMYVNGYTPSSQGFSFSLGGTAILGCDLPVILPIELIHFNTKAEADYVSLSWATLSEKNNRYFSIERSPDGQNFVEIIRKPGSGNSLQRTEYVAEDRHPIAGISYYRLSQTDQNGHTKNLPIEKVSWDPGLSDFHIQPNPSAEKNISVYYTCNSKDPVTLQVSDLSGKIVFTEKLPCTEHHSKQLIDISDWETGMYLFQFILPNELHFKRFIKN